MKLNKNVNSAIKNTSYKWALQIHKESIHTSFKYKCEECDFVAHHLSSLKMTEKNRRKKTGNNEEKKGRKVC